MVSRQADSAAPPARVRRSVSPERYVTVVLIAAIMLVVIVLTGAAVRLTASGLGCEDWPRCSSDRFIPEWGLHGWIEFGNRLLSGAVGVSVMAAVLSAYWREPRRRDLIVWAWGLVAGVVGQIVLGGVTVLVDLHPGLVAAHFLLSIVLLWNVVVLLHKARRPHAGPMRPMVGRRLIGLSRVVVAWAVVVLVVGTVVTGTGPHGGDSRADRWPLDLESVIRVHSVTAWVLVALAVALAVGLGREGRPALNRMASISLGAIFAQGVVGYIQFFTGVPAALVEVHVFGSILVFTSLLWTHLNLWETSLSETVDLTAPEPTALRHPSTLP